MSAQKPVILSDVCSNSDILPRDGGILVDPHSVSHLEEALLKAMQTNSKERGSMGLANSRRVQKMFSPKLITQQYLDLIK